MTPNNPVPYIALEHSGDLRIRAIGEDFYEALANASIGLIAQMIEPERILEQEERTASVEGETDEEQAIALLNEILYLVYAERWLVRRVRQIKRCGRTECRTLDAVLSGEPLDLNRHDFRHEIKAVTYHDFIIRHEPGQTVIEFLCDL